MRASPDIVINHATVRERMRLDAFLAGCAERGMRQVSIWGDEVERTGLDNVRSLLAQTGLTVFGYNRAGPLTATGPAERADRAARARREIEIAAALGADHVMVFTGGLPAGSRDLTATRRRVADTVAGLTEHAGTCGVKLAIEPLHPMLAGDRTCLTTLAEANDLCDRLGDGAGIVIDVYHVWWDPALEAEIRRAGSRILGFHVNDWLVPTGHVLRDRGMMGDGIIDLAGIHGLVREAGYDGPVEVEVFSDRWWAEDPDVAIDTAIRRCRDIFGSAAGSERP